MLTLNKTYQTKPKTIEQINQLRKEIKLYDEKGNCLHIDSEPAKLHPWPWNYHYCLICGQFFIKK